MNQSLLELEVLRRLSKSFMRGRTARAHAPRPQMASFQHGCPVVTGDRHVQHIDGLNLIFEEKELLGLVLVEPGEKLKGSL